MHLFLFSCGGSVAVVLCSLGLCWFHQVANGFMTPGLPTALKVQRNSGGRFAGAFNFRKISNEMLPNVSSQRITRKSAQATDDKVMAPLLKHSDIVWKLRVTPDTPWLDKVKIKISATLLYWDFLRQGIEPPAILCPSTTNQQVVLESHASGQKVGRFGITVSSGPPLIEIQETVSELYGDAPVGGVRSAAIIYMFVEPNYRRRSVGKLALEVISFIHAYQKCDFTVLVADDDGSGKLIEWYERMGGFQRAPKLQRPFGSPEGQFGTTMIAPTNATLPKDCRIKWW